MEAELKALLTQTVTITGQPTATAYGAAVAGAAASWPTRARYKRQEIATNAGESVIAEGHLWLDVDVPVPGIRDRLTLPNGTTSAVVAVDVVADDVGHHHTKVYFGVPANG